MGAAILDSSVERERAPSDACGDRVGVGANVVPRLWLVTGGW